MVFLEVRTGYFCSDNVDVFFGGTNKVDSFEVHQLLVDILDLLDQINIVFVEFRLRVNYGNNAGCFRVQN